MAFTTSPNMNLTIPSVGTQPGPDYAFNNNNSLTLIDQHDHTPGKGVQIVTAALNINADLSLNDFSLIDATSIVFTPSTSASTTPQSLSVAPGGESPQQQDLWYTPNTGVPIQITKNGAVNVVASSIEGESYAAGTFFWTQAQDALPTTPANFDIGSITLRPNTALTTFGVILSPASAIASEYQINLPLIPLSKKILTLNTSGNMVADTDVDNVTIEINSNNLRVKSINGATNIDPGTITTTQISPTAGITQGQLADSAFEWTVETFTTSPASFAVKAATTANITLSGAQTIDGVSCIAGDLVLAKNQNTAASDGVYVVAAGAWARSTSYDTVGELNYAGVVVTSGTVNAGRSYFQNNILSSLSDAQLWTRSQTQAFTIPSGVNLIYVELIGGGGGGGGGGANSAGQAGSGGAGGSGCVPFFNTLQVTPGDLYAMTSGGGGLGGAINGGTGGGGEASYITNASNAVVTYTPGALGGAGGAATTATTTGTSGFSGVTLFAGGFTTTGGNGGGGAPNSGSNATVGSSGGIDTYITTAATPGTSAAASVGLSPSGPGGGGGAGLGIGGNGGNGWSASTTGSAGSPGNDYGSGGGGGGGAQGTTPQASKVGGAGARGVIKLYYLRGS